LTDVAEPHRGGGRVRDRIIAFKLRIPGIDGGERLRLPFVIDGTRLLLLDAAHERRLGRIDPVDDVGQILAVADRLVGRKGVRG
jgi:hypothetical protein